ncbi:MAG: hypothetical protein Q6358_13835 [Candidatus Brocadiales bacterium]|nr:hypothetical protein [Candidatus Brocadiales bacterium]
MIGLKKAKEDLRNYEDKFKMDSETFYKKYLSGEVGDDFEYIRWAGEVGTLKKLEKNLKNF